MEAAGSVIRARSDEDRRFVKARITDEGLSLLGELDEPILRMHEEQLGHMSPPDLARLVDLLEAARAGG